MSPYIPCSACGANLVDYSEVGILSGVESKDDHEGKHRLRITLRCYECEATFDTFVAVEDFAPMDGG